MTGYLSTLVLVAAFAVEPVNVSVDRGAEGLEIRFELAEALPQTVETSLSSGATTEIAYSVRVYGRRRFFPDRKIWKGIARATVRFDAVTGRYVCQLIVNGSTTTSGEIDTLDAARGWLRAPPPIEVSLPEARREASLRVRVRAVFASGTAWLVFPSTDGTDWVEISNDPPPVDSVE
jgi:hypothetical protein